MVTRQDQMALMAKKKSQANPSKKDGTTSKEPSAALPEEPAFDEDEDRASKGRRASKAPKTRSGAKKALAEDDEADDGKAKKRGKPCPVTRKASKRRLMCKGRSKAKGKSSKAPDVPDNATVYYGDINGDWEEGGEEGEDWTAEEWAAWNAPASKRARTMSSGKNGPAPEEEAPQEEGEEEQEEGEEEEEDDEDVPTFARRYCPSRPWYRAKFFAIRDAFNDRIRPFVKCPGKLEDTCC